MIRWFLALGGLGGGFTLLADASDIGSVPLQVGALGILGTSVWYVLWKIVPDIIKTRKEEQASFVATMERISEKHAENVSEIHARASEEREKWIGTITKVDESIRKNTEAMSMVTDAVRRCEDRNRGIFQKGS